MSHCDVEPGERMMKEDEMLAESECARTTSTTPCTGLWHSGVWWRGRVLFTRHTVSAAYLQGWVYRRRVSRKVHSQARIYNTIPKKESPLFEVRHLYTNCPIHAGLRRGRKGEERHLSLGVRVVFPSQRVKEVKHASSFSLVDWRSASTHLDLHPWRLKAIRKLTSLFARPLDILNIQVTLESIRFDVSRRPSTIS